MDTTDVMRLMVAASGKSAIALSRELGRGDTFLTSTMTRRSRPRVDTFVAFARACGYEVVLRGHGEELSLSDALGEDGPAGKKA